MVDAVSTTAAAGRVGGGAATLASNFETFMSLLTAQLRNQDPLSPLDSNEFTAQLTQMAGVEQQLLTNDLLTSLLSAQQAGDLTNAAAYIGREVSAVFSATKLQDGKATWSYELADKAKDVQLQVLDSKGQVVWSGDAPSSESGIHDFTWNGQTTGGGKFDDGGVFTLKVVAKDTAGEAVDSQVLIRGRVISVEKYGDQPYLTVGGSVLPMSSVIAIEAQKASSQNPDTEA